MHPLSVLFEVKQSTHEIQLATKRSAANVARTTAAQAAAAEAANAEVPEALCFSAERLPSGPPSPRNPDGPRRMHGSMDAERRLLEFYYVEIRKSYGKIAESLLHIAHERVAEW